MTSLQRRVGAMAAVMVVALVASFLPGQNITSTAGDSRVKAAEAKRLIAVLRSDAPLFDKARACQQLSVIGDKDAVPELVPLLADEKLAAYARCGLESIADPCADAALREAAGRLQGKLLAGVVNSIGVRRDAKAVDLLGRLARDRGTGVADEALTALGRIATPKAVGIVQQALKADAADARLAAADACLTSAERLLVLDQRALAVSLYDVVRQADVPKHVRAAATFGAIIARQSAGLPLLVEQFQSDDSALFAAAIRQSRRMPGGEVTQSLLAALNRLPPARQVLVLGALGDRRDAAVLPVVRKMAASGPSEVRLAAIQALGQLNDAASAPLLLDTIMGNETSLAQTAQTSLMMLHGNGIEEAVAAKLNQGSRQARIALLEIVADRRIASAAGDVLKVADDSNAEFRHAAIRTLGRIIGPEDLPALTGRLLAAKTPDETAVLKESLSVACSRISDRDACVGKLAGCMSGAPPATQCFLLDLIGRVGGPQALKIVSGHAHGGSGEIQDAATRVLGDWKSADAAPELLNLAKTLPEGKLKVRSLRGYIRLARQMDLSPEQRIRMCEEALRMAQRDDERKLALEILVRIPSAKTLALAASYLARPALKEPAAGVAIAIAEKIVRAEPQAVAAAMQQTLQAGVSGEKAVRAKTVLEKISLKRTSVFDGRSFAGWEGDTKNTFRIEDGAIVGGSLKQRVPHNAFLCTTRSYTNFVLWAECKLVGRANGGIQIRSQRVPNHYEVSGFQADMDTGPDGGYWGTLYDESRRNRTIAVPDKTLLRSAVKPGDWNLYEIRCEGPRIRLFLNGVQTVDYTEKDEKIPQSGIIGLQIHGGEPSEAWYRKITIEELP
ncbi:MAG: DUF1080 domain-containing protein [Thermoguttaceae bacterium]